MMPESIKQYGIQLFLKEVLIALIILFLILFLWLDLSWFSMYSIQANGSDSIGAMILIKSAVMGDSSNLLLQNGGNLSFPLRFNLFDYPSVDFFNFLLAKIFYAFTNNVIIATNLFFIFTFITPLVTSLLVLRYYRVNLFISIFISILFVLTPYHFVRFYRHLMLSSYFSIPLWVFISINTNNFLYFHKSKLINVFLYLLLILILSSTGVYYSFCGLLIFTIMRALSYNRNILKLQIKYYLSIAIPVITIVFIQILPSIFYTYKHGKNTLVAFRSPDDAITYGMRIFDLFIKPTTKYSSMVISSGESNSLYLGVLASIGALFSLLIIFRSDKFERIYCTLSKINLIVILLSTVGGFGLIFAVFISPMIRGYNRFSIFIEFNSLFIIALFLSSYCSSKKLKAWKTLCYSCILCSVCLYLDSYNSNFRTTEEVKQINTENILFIDKLTKILPSGAGIFQLPYQAFPESPRINKMDYYANSVLSFYSDKLSWSYGAMKGRPLANKIEEISALPIDDNFIRQVASLRYSGIVINTDGYQDNAESLINQLSGVLEEKPIYSGNKNFVFFNLLPYVSKNHPKLYNLDEINSSIFYDGFYSKEDYVTTNWMWSKNLSKIVFRNSSEHNVKYHLNMTYDAPLMKTSDYLTVSWNGISKDQFNESSGVIDHDIIVEPDSKYVVEFKTNAPRVYAPTDSREMYFRIVDPKITLAESI